MLLERVRAPEAVPFGKAMAQLEGRVIELGGVRVPWPAPVAARSVTSPTLGQRVG